MNYSRSLHESMACHESPRSIAALLHIGWFIKRETAGSHRILSRPVWPDVFAFHDGTEIGPRVLARIAKKTGLQPSDL